MAAVRIHLLRHGRIASHRGDVPVTQEGLREVGASGRRFAAELEPGEVVSFFTTATLRSRETANALHQTIQSTLDDRADGNQEVTITLMPPVEEFAIRNPDIFIAGRRVEMVSTGEAMAEQIPDAGLGADEIKIVPFYRDFFPHQDRVGYWLRHPDPPGENADAVARRLMTFGISLLDLPSDRPRRYVWVTHSPLLRAFLQRYLLGEDPGEPEFVESVDVTFPGDRSLTMRFREHVVSSPLPLGSRILSAASKT